MILALLFNFKPFICPGCKEAAREIICESCLTSMRKNHCILRVQKDGLRGIFPIFISNSTTHQILVFWKDHAGDELKKILFSPSPELLKHLTKIHFDVIIPIPQNVERSLKRGHASGFEVAKLFSLKLNVPLDLSLSLRNLSMEKQANLSEWDRRHSENPFFCKHPKYNKTIKKILLVDDFITSGSTLDKATNAIMEIYPSANIYAASLGWKPKKIYDSRSRISN